MATITPTRMVLNQMKGRLKTAVRGHKLLKDKRDELMRRFMEIVHENKVLRETVDQKLGVAFAALSMANALLPPDMLEQALVYSNKEISLDVTYKNVMSVNVPHYEFRGQTEEEEMDEVPYGFLQSSMELDDAIFLLKEAFPDMLRLAEIEKTLQMLAEEIEKTRRRVNALEYVMIPELQENIKYISMKLAENENSTKVRLIKVKAMVLENAHHYKEREA